MRVDTEVALAGLTSSQLGHITRAQAAAAGLGGAGVRRRLASAAWVAVGASTFRVTGWPVSLEGQVLAACLDLDGVASHRSAAWLHGLVPAPSQIHVSTRRHRSVWTPTASPPVRVHTSTNLPADDIARVGLIPVTSVARTMLGLASEVPSTLTEEGLLQVVSAAIEGDVASLPWLWWMLDRRRCRGRNGVRALERALTARSALGPTESWLEREVLRILADAGLPRPHLQRVIGRDGRTTARVDFLYPAEAIVLEALGYAFHRTEAQLLADTMRANDLTVAGYKVHQFTSRQIATAPETLVATVGAALAAAPGPHPV